MATVKSIHSRASIGNAIRYVTKTEKTEEKLISGIHCRDEKALDDMKSTKQLWGKTGGRQYDHYVQAFHKDENITPEKAHMLACQLAKEKFPNHECLVATHKDTDHVHSHIIVNSVSFENGKKLHTNSHWIDKLRSYSDELCREHGLTITQAGKTFHGQDREDMTAANKDKYNFLEKASRDPKIKSYVLETAKAVMDCKEKATSREDFISKMKERGYDVDWDSRKTVTFIDLERQKNGETFYKVRNSNLEKTFKIPLGKEQLEHEFKNNARTTEHELTADERELYNAMHRIAEHELAKDNAREWVNERVREIENSGGDKGFRQPAEETGPSAERVREEDFSPSNAVREIEKRTRKLDCSSRGAYRENLSHLIRQRDEFVRKHQGTDKKLNSVTDRRELTQQRINFGVARKSELSRKLEQLLEKRVQEQSIERSR